MPAHRTDDESRTPANVPRRNRTWAVGITNVGFEPPRRRAHQSRDHSREPNAVSTNINLALASRLFTHGLFPPLTNNGGRLPTHALIERGLAVDAGYCPGENGDQRGFPRPYDDVRVPNALDGCDIGAFEWNPPQTKRNGPKP